MVLAPNNTETQVTEFIMMCFPGMQDTQHWLSIVLAPLLVLAFGANFVLLFTIWQETSLHEPMYYLLAILSVLDVILCLTVIPKVRPSLDSLPGTQSYIFKQYFIFLLQMLIFLKESAL
jgi:olfactory receptor